ncbi:MULTISPECIES: IclR family transcriptional regulator [unclassified Rhodococcus (in: high G+C Gram-positive bacteria)]|uniref:IclR family transcriptional regulator n=1 Tax=unclassified Rhodococcus (in: high G+C Gram-positive bacteria) TaxID=192944 RepID=UPI00163A68F0|nr:MULTISPECIES: IclR family transcriptional regulator C-terminal domain-containing protein [unclassified Rhodococcus (in: high G+C Gram-positive bacteria)]MBC2639380.1 helix-turn-helix domain-containing protein [Rhodococcus sp. 3A]MBC2895875.1 helix-turn-helix domain-containing protein [Rhodococcus sp. 4CII]
MGARAGEIAGHEPRAVQKALALLEAVAQLGSGATARDIAAHAGIPQATAYRLLNLLTADGYLVRIADLSGFALGRRTRQLAGAGAAPEPVDYHAVLDDVREQVRFGIHLASFAGSRVRLVDRDPDHELSGEATITAHLHASAIGKILLASRPDLLPQNLRRVTSRTVTEFAALHAELDAVRRTGSAREVDEVRVGRSSVAVPVLDAQNAVMGCVAAIGKTGRLAVDDPELTDLLRSCAARVGGRVPA